MTEETKEEDILGTLSVQAMEGVKGGGTMKVKGCLEGKPVLVLFDSGSSHSFLQLQAAQKLGYNLEVDRGLAMVVANGHNIVSSRVYKNVGWTIKGRSSAMT